MKARSWLRRTEQQDSEDDLEFWKNSPMASFVFECFFCLLPFLLVLLLSAAPRWPRVHYWTNRAVRAAGWRLWVIICWILELPPDGNTRARTKEAGSPGTDFLMGSVQGSEGLRVICKPTALAKYLQRHCYPLFHPRLASWPRGDPHLQTLSNMLYDKCADRLQFTRDHLLLRDGGVVALDWAVGTRLVEASGRRRKECLSTGKALGCFTAAPPVLLVIPQYWGGMTPHLKVLCHQAVQQGFYVVVFHARGTAGCPLTTTRLTEFGDPADLEQVRTKKSSLSNKTTWHDWCRLRREGSLPVEHVVNNLKLPLGARGKAWRASPPCGEPRCAAVFHKTPSKASWELKKKKPFVSLFDREFCTIHTAAAVVYELVTTWPCKTSQVGAFQERSSGFQTWHLSAAFWLPGKITSKEACKTFDSYHFSGDRVVFHCNKRLFWKSVTPCWQDWPKSLVNPCFKGPVCKTLQHPVIRIRNNIYIFIMCSFKPMETLSRSTFSATVGTL